MSKRTWTVIGVVIVIVAVGAIAFLNMHKTATPTAAKQADVPATNTAVVMTKTSSTLGQYLTDANGRALYTYNKDEAGVSNCSAACLATWPAYTDSGSTATLPSGVSTIIRSDNGKKQYTYGGMPLYYFADDTAGQVTGNGVGGFSVAKPTSTASASAAATPVPVSASTPDPAAASAAAPASTPVPTAAPTTAPSSGDGW